MRSIQIKQMAAFASLLCGCGASTGLQLGTSEASGADGSLSNSGGAVGAGGAAAEGGIGGSIDIAYGTGGRPTGAGGMSILVSRTGGYSATGGNKALGGAKAATGGAYLYTGGAKAASGGNTPINTGGAQATGGSFGTGGATATSSMKIANDGWAEDSAGLYVLHGYIFSFAGGSSSSITLNWDTYSSFCAKGTVAANPTYISYAGAGFDVNQPTTSSGGAAALLVIDAKLMIVSFTNPGNSPLRIQMNDPNNDNWCYDISNATSPVTIPLASFNTACWNDSGSFFAPGTAITSIALVVPGDSVVDTPYSFCLLGVTFE